MPLLRRSRGSVSGETIVSVPISPTYMALCAAYEGKGGHPFFHSLHSPPPDAMEITLSYDLINALVAATRERAEPQEQEAVSSFDKALLHKKAPSKQKLSTSSPPPLLDEVLSREGIPHGDDRRAGINIEQLSLDLPRTRFEIPEEERPFFENSGVLPPHEARQLATDGTVSSMSMIKAWEKQIATLQKDQETISDALKQSAERGDQETMLAEGARQCKVLKDLGDARTELKKAKALFLFAMMSNSFDKGGFVVQGGVLQECQTVLSLLMSSAAGDFPEGIALSGATQAINEHGVRVMVDVQVGTSEELTNAKLASTGEAFTGMTAMALKAQYQFLLSEKEKGYRIALDPQDYSVTMTQSDWERFRGRAELNLTQKLPRGSEPVQDREILTEWDVLSLIPLLEGNKPLCKILNEKLGKDQTLRQQTSDWIAVCYPGELQNGLRRLLRLPRSSPSPLSSSMSSTSLSMSPPLSPVEGEGEGGGSSESGSSPRPR